MTVDDCRPSNDADDCRDSPTGETLRPRGTAPDSIRRAIDACDSFPGTCGFAGDVDGLLVRDVLGRVPLFVDDEPADGERTWAFDPTSLTEPIAFPAGCVAPIDADGHVDVADAERVWELSSPDPATESRADVALDPTLDRLGSTIERVTTDVSGTDLAVAFSGGVDSALLAAMLDAPLYVVGFPDGRDVEAAREAVEAMGRTADLRVEELTLEQVERAVPVVATAIGRTNPMDVSIALSLYLVAERAAADGYDRLVLGQGADELFGGYEKVQRLDHRIDAETVPGAIRELLEGLPAQLERDVLAVEAAGVRPVMPYLHDDVIELARTLPETALVREDTRKYALRRIAREYVPTDIADREKTAIQYGSQVARELDRLARQAGYKRRMDDHVGQYVRSRMEAR